MYTIVVSEESVTWGVVCSLSGGLCPCVLLPWWVRNHWLGIFSVALLAACARVYYHGKGPAAYKRHVRWQTANTCHTSSGQPLPVRPGIGNGHFASCNSCCFPSTETILRIIRDGARRPPALSHNSWTLSRRRCSVNNPHWACRYRIWYWH